MCGIAGIFRMDGRAVSSDEVQSMVDRIRHRGPDAQGVDCHENVGLGHVRLSIIDLAPESNQPFHHENGRLSLVFNGEIFNYVELRAELEGLGHRFRTRSDTEVLLKAYEQWGSECVNRFYGMWAFAIYDRDKKSLFCSRDRFGLKPFRYAVTTDSFYFSSEVKAMLAVEPQLASPNYDVISQLLRTGLSGDLEETCFEKVNQLLPAHNLTVNQDGVTITRYWNYPQQDPQEISHSDAAEKLREMLEFAVKIRLRSDVPVGISLSGGLDSSTIAELAKHYTDQSLHTFTAIYDDQDQDESAIATETAKRLGFTPHLIRCSGDQFNDLLRTVIRHVENPHNSPAMLPCWEIMKAARERDVKVMLEGQGADEALAGYPANFFAHAILDNCRLNKLGKLSREFRASYATVAGLIGKGAFWGGLARAIFPQSHHYIRKWRGDEQVYIGPLHHSQIKNVTLPGVSTRESGGSLNSRLRFYHQHLLPGLYMYGDAMSMAHGVESRCPFNDYPIVELAFSLPGHHKFENGIGKTILRRAVQGLIPAPIVKDRRKLGFTTPIRDWLIRKPNENMLDILMSPECQRRGIFSQKHVKKIIDQHLSRRHDHSALIFRWLTTEIWFQEFIDRKHT